jgi:hypothetical protein
MSMGTMLPSLGCSASALMPPGADVAELLAASSECTPMDRRNYVHFPTPHGSPSCRQSPASQEATFSSPGSDASGEPWRPFHVCRIDTDSWSYVVTIIVIATRVSENIMREAVPKGVKTRDLIK